MRKTLQLLLVAAKKKKKKEEEKEEKRKHCSSSSGLQVAAARQSNVRTLTADEMQYGGATLKLNKTVRNSSGLKPEILPIHPTIRAICDYNHIRIHGSINRALCVCC